MLLVFAPFVFINFGVTEKRRKIGMKRGGGASSLAHALLKRYPIKLSKGDPLFAPLPLKQQFLVLPRTAIA